VWRKRTRFSLSYADWCLSSDVAFAGEDPLAIVTTMCVSRNHARSWSYLMVFELLLCCAPWMKPGDPNPRTQANFSWVIARFPTCRGALVPIVYSAIDLLSKLALVQWYVERVIILWSLLGGRKKLAFETVEIVTRPKRWSHRHEAEKDNVSESKLIWT